ncbi:hypothetical protein [Conexibacter sp. CPCC 206217]|uniref:hypothetical protein n=1 Tax=Conexibacter sp. CPCC 206217 TaxID=3064574 RepID=UPI0027196444|nr:hypothetical protein [Conexibacter sp. CPCC 206217]MDO8214158.1 hypothetical protein [Conexibacter sp. CPCC 206217]
MIDEPAIQKIVARLARTNATGGKTIERAALLAEGSNFGEIEAWILARGGEPEIPGARAGATGGLHGVRIDASRRRASSGAPVRYLLPAGALS